MANNSLKFVLSESSYLLVNADRFGIGPSENLLLVSGFCVNDERGKEIIAKVMETTRTLRDVKVEGRC